MQNQNEYDLNLEVTNEDSSVGIINAKIQFIRSLQKYYTDICLSMEKRKNKIQTSIDESQRMLDNLVEPFEFLNQFNNVADNKSLVSFRTVFSTNSSRNNYNTASGGNSNPSTGDNVYVKEIESYLKTNFLSKNFG